MKNTKQCASKLIPMMKRLCGGAVLRKNQKCQKRCNGLVLRKLVGPNSDASSSDQEYAKEEQFCYRLVAMRINLHIVGPELG